MTVLNAITTRPFTAALLPPVLAIALLSAVLGCTQDRKLDQIRRGIDDVDRHSQEIEKTAEPGP